VDKAASADDALIVCAIVDLAHQWELEVVAEAVEIPTDPGSAGDSGL
jgi:EAL domain-containing protein (putative c-di-GMP-specific phosphodiesterase class I)